MAKEKTLHNQKKVKDDNKQAKDKIFTTYGIKKSWKRIRFPNKSEFMGYMSKTLVFVLLFITFFMTTNAAVAYGIDKTGPKVDYSQVYELYSNLGVTPAEGLKVEYTNDNNEYTPTKVYIVDEENEKAKATISVLSAEELEELKNNGDAVREEKIVMLNNTEWLITDKFICAEADGSYIVVQSEGLELDDSRLMDTLETVYLKTISYDYEDTGETDVISIGEKEEGTEGIESTTIDIEDNSETDNNE